MSAVVEEYQPWSRVRWTTAISLAVGVQLVLALAFSQQPSSKPRPTAAAHVILPEHLATELQELTDPTLFARGSRRNSSTTWLELPALPPVDTAWDQPVQWLALDAETLGRTFLELARANGSSLHRPSFKSAPKPSLASTLASPTPVRTASTLQAIGDLADRPLLNAPQLPSWPAKTLLLPSEVRVVVDARGWVTSAILVSGSGSEQADQFAVAQARKMRFSAVHREAEALTLGHLLFMWHTTPEADTPQPAKSQ